MATVGGKGLSIYKLVSVCQECLICVTRLGSHKLSTATAQCSNNDATSTLIHSSHYNV